MKTQILTILNMYSFFIMIKVNSKQTMNHKQSIRPAIKSITETENQSEEERFQNEVLRPILKLQHELLVLFFESHTIKKKVVFTDLSTLQKQVLVDDIFKKDSQYKIELRGLIIGHFTTEEYKTYQKMTVEVNKRIMSMAKERLLSTI